MICSVALTLEAKLPCVSITPFGSPVGQEGGIDRHRHRAQVQDGMVEGGPLRAVLREDRHAVALAYSDRLEPESQRPHGGDELVGRDVAPDPARLVAQEGRLAEVRLEIGEDVAERPDLHARIRSRSLTFQTSSPGSRPGDWCNWCTCPE